MIMKVESGSEPQCEPESERILITDLTLQSERIEQRSSVNSVVKRGVDTTGSSQL